MDDEQDFVKIVIDLPEGDLGVFGEGVWAKPLGDDLYEVQNSPWHSREINYLDVVRAIEPSPDKKPVVESVVSRGGHRTIQIIVLEAGEGKKDEVLKELNALGATWEGADNKLFAIDFAPDVSWDAAKDYLQACTDQELLEFRWSSWGFKET